MVDDVVNRETGSVRLTEDAIGKIAQQSLPLLKVHAGVVGLECMANERASAALRGENIGSLQRGIHLRDRIGVDAEVLGQLSHGWQPVTRAQPSGGNRRANGPLELGVEWRRVALIDE